MHDIYYNIMATNVSCMLLWVLSKSSLAILFPNSFGVGYEQKCSCWLSPPSVARGVGISRAARQRPCPVPCSSSPFVTPGSLNATSLQVLLSQPAERLCPNSRAKLKQLIHSSEILYKTSAVNESHSLPDPWLHAPAWTQMKDPLMSHLSPSLWSFYWDSYVPAHFLPIFCQYYRKTNTGKTNPETIENY